MTKMRFFRPEAVTVKYWKEFAQDPKRNFRMLDSFGWASHRLENSKRHGLHIYSYCRNPKADPCFGSTEEALDLLADIFEHYERPDLADVVRPVKFDESVLWE